MGQIFLLSLLLLAVSHHHCHGCFYGWGSGIISELSGYWIQVSRNSDVFLVWITLKLFCAVLLYWKADSRVGFGSSFTRPNTFRSFLYVLGQSEPPNIMTGEESKTTKKLDLVCMSILYLKIYKGFCYCCCCWVFSFWIQLKICKSIKKS